MGLILQPQVTQTRKGEIVTYVYMKAPLDVQEATFPKFTDAGLSMVSPAELGYLETAIPYEENPFLMYSRTDMDVFNDTIRDKTNPVVVLIPGGALSRQFLSDIVQAHKKNREYIIPHDRRDSVYDIVDEMVAQKRAFVTTHGAHSIKSSELGQKDLAKFLFTDPSLGITATDRGDSLIRIGIKYQDILFDKKDYALSQEGPYLNRLSMYGRKESFQVIGNGRRHGRGGAFAVHFEKTV